MVFALEEDWPTLQGILSALSKKVVAIGTVCTDFVQLSNAVQFHQARLLIRLPAADTALSTTLTPARKRAREDLPTYDDLYFALESLLLSV